jgi:hypothetical protein
MSGGLNRSSQREEALAIVECGIPKRRSQTRYIVSYDFKTDAPAAGRELKMVAAVPVFAR